MMLGTDTRRYGRGSALRAEALRSLPYREAQSSGYAFQVEMAMRAHEGGLKVVEVPISFRDRTRGTSKMGTGIVVEAMRLVTVWGWKRAVRGCARGGGECHGQGGWPR